MFGAGYLTVNVLLSYIESIGNSGLVPTWEDLRYRISWEKFYVRWSRDVWGRRLCRTYLEELFQPDLLEGELLLASNFPASAEQGLYRVSALYRRVSTSRALLLLRTPS